METSSHVDVSSMEKAIRYKGKWYKIIKKPYESERQTTEISWLIIKEGISSLEAYRKWYAQEREDAKLLYPSFRKNE